MAEAHLLPSHVKTCPAAVGAVFDTFDKFSNVDGTYGVLAKLVYSK